MLADDAGALDPFVEAAEKLIETLAVSELNSHAFSVTPPRGHFAAEQAPPKALTSTQGQPCMIAGIAPAIHSTGYREDSIVTRAEVTCQNEASFLLRLVRQEEFP
jgi:hypothetical protein